MQRVSSVADITSVSAIRFLADFAGVGDNVLVFVGNWFFAGIFSDFSDIVASDGDAVFGLFIVGFDTGLDRKVCS